MMLGWEPVVCVTHQHHTALHMSSGHPSAEHKLSLEGLEVFCDQDAGGIELHSGSREPVSYTSSSPSLSVL